jgi:uncharacterized protein (TIGR02118 family)
MIIVSVLYPNEAGKRFDMGYYLDTHVPMVKNLLGAALTNVTVQKGIAGGTPGSTAAYVTMGHLHFDSIESFMASFGPHSDAIVGDLPNFTDLLPVLQISEVML